MFLNESDKTTGRVAINTPSDLKLNANNALNQFSVDSDATVGTLTFTVTPRKGKTPEPLLESDGTTQVVIDFATTRRTVVGIGGYKEVQVVAAGMNGTYYELFASGGDA